MNNNILEDAIHGNIKNNITEENFFDILLCVYYQSYIDLNIQIVYKSIDLSETIHSFIKEHVNNESFIKTFCQRMLNDVKYIYMFSIFLMNNMLKLKTIFTKDEIFIIDDAMYYDTEMSKIRTLYHIDYLGKTQDYKLIHEFINHIKDKKIFKYDYMARTFPVQNTKEYFELLCRIDPLYKNMIEILDSKIVPSKQCFLHP